MQPAGNYARIGSAICQGKAVTVAVLTCDSDHRQWFGGFGDVEKASKVFVINELIPLQKRFMEINAWLGEKLIEFSPYELN